MRNGPRPHPLGGGNAPRCRTRRREECCGGARLDETRRHEGELISRVSDEVAIAPRFLDSVARRSETERRRRPGHYARNDTILCATILSRKLRAMAQSTRLRGPALKNRAQEKAGPLRSK